MTPAKFRWGMLLILVGLLLLLRNLELIDSYFWMTLTKYSPFILIAVGLEKIFTGSRLQPLAYLTTLLLVTGALYLAFEPAKTGPDWAMWDEKEFRLLDDGTANTIVADIEVANGRLTIRDSGEDVVFAKVAKFRGSPDFESRVQDGEARVIFASDPNELFGNVIKIEVDDEPDDWNLVFSHHLPLSLKCRADECDIHFNFTTTPLQELNLRADQSDIYLKVGTLEDRVTISVDGNESSLKLRVPQSFGLKVSGLSDDAYLLELGLQERDGSFVNDVYSIASQLVDITLDDRLSSVSIDYY